MTTRTTGWSGRGQRPKRIDDPAGDVPADNVWRRPRTWIVAGLIFLALGVVNAFGIFAQILQFEEATGWEALRFSMLRMIPFWMFAYLLLPIPVWITHRFPPFGPKWPRNLLVHLVTALPFTLLRLSMGYSVAYLITPPAYEVTLGAFLFGGLVSSTGSGVTIYLATVGAVIAVDHYFESRARERQAARAELRAAQLETSLERSRLEWLRSQLDPHFLFNALNSISTLARQGNAKAVVAGLGRLGDLLRATLDRDRAVSTLEEELAFLDMYLDIERMRLGDRVGIHVEVTEEARRARLPALLLQPLVENALKHGAGATRGPVDVHVTGQVDGDRLRLRVRDTGRGFPDTWSEGVGLGNTLQRLDQLFGDAGRFEIDSSDAGATVTLTLPYDPVPAEAGSREPEPAEPVA